jgi:hypothetical protein
MVKEKKETDSIGVKKQERKIETDSIGIKKTGKKERHEKSETRIEDKKDTLS